jgi:oligopeptide/dipeptide ABC transporter ATP-binding protein
MIFQDARGSLNPVMTIGAQLSEAIRAHQEIPRRELQEKMTALLEEVGMPDPPFWLCKYPMELSGGMCQIVALALAVSNRPAILIADEPTSALDAGIQAQVLDLLRRMKQRQRLALILISHDLTVVPEICDRVAIMYHGRVVECGGAEDVFRAPAPPYTDLLAKCRADLDHRWDRNPLAAITGVPPSGGQEFPGCAFAPRCPKAEAGCAQSVPAPQFVADGHWAACFRMNHAAAAG